MRYIVSGLSSAGSFGHPLAEAGIVLRYVEGLKRRDITTIKILDEVGCEVSEKQLRDAVPANRA
jgi:hypothetical protein